MIRKLQLLAVGVISFGDALICKFEWLDHPSWLLASLCWSFAITSIVACWKLIKILEKE